MKKVTKKVSLYYLQDKTHNEAREISHLGNSVGQALTNESVEALVALKIPVMNRV